MASLNGFHSPVCTKPGTLKYRPKSMLLNLSHGINKFLPNFMWIYFLACLSILGQFNVCVFYRDNSLLTNSLVVNFFSIQSLLDREKENADDWGLIPCSDPPIIASRAFGKACKLAT